MSIAILPAQAHADLLVAIDALAVFALTSTLERFMADEELLCLAVSTCLQQTPETLDGIEAAVAAGHNGPCAALAHGLKGAVATCGAERMAAVAKRIEELAKAGQAAAAAPLVPVLRAAFEAFRGEAAAELSL